MQEEITTNDIDMATSLKYTTQNIYSENIYTYFLHGTFSSSSHETACLLVVVYQA